ncbi:hypothetical protein HYU12_00075 [Candidatus Woesearchaeota archaeon]|nr:hypothetical protein [Candidatus Woesearchaeota archaeon]
MLKASIVADDRGGFIRNCFASEDREIKGKAKYEVVKSGSKVVFEVSAVDSVALRTVLNSITKMLTVIEKMERL